MVVSEANHRVIQIILTEEECERFLLQLDKIICGKSTNADFVVEFYNHVSDVLGEK